MKKWIKIIAWFQFLSLLLLSLFAGVMCGITFERWRFSENRSPIEIGDFSEKISLLHFNIIENGILKGSLEGEEVRIVVRNAKEPYSLFPGEFAFSVEEILPLLQKIPAPEGMAFVASKNGKYFYPLDSPRAALITPKNRIFFRDEQHAENEGFFPKL
jgi:hypothetical protein